MANQTIWTIGYKDESHEQAIREEYSTDSRLTARWKDFERDVTVDPFFHPKRNRIRKLRDSRFPEGTWRYSKDPIRVIYYPEKKTKVVYPLEVASATTVSYKRRSRR
jgi:hypothetical protein